MSNETQARDELVGLKLMDEVRDIIQETAVDVSGDGTGMWEAGWAADINDAADRIIALVTAARDAEIREAYAEVGRYAEKVLGAIGLGDSEGEAG